MIIKRFRSTTGAFTFVEIMIVTGLIGMLATIAIPNFLRSRTEARKQICIENLSQIESAKQLWGLDSGKGNGALPDDTQLAEYLKRQPLCPGGGTYEVNPLGRPATCTIPGHEY